MSLTINLVIGLLLGQYRGQVDLASALLIQLKNSCHFLCAITLLFNEFLQCPSFIGELMELLDMKNCIDSSMLSMCDWRASLASETVLGVDNAKSGICYMYIMSRSKKYK